MTERPSTDAPGFAWAPGGERRSLVRAQIGYAVAIACVGAAILALAISADNAWFDRHFLPSFFLPRHWYWIIYEIVRWTLVALGAGLVATARPLGARLNARVLRRVLLVAVAGALALGCAELVLRRVHLRPTEWLMPGEEPRRRADPRLGWTLAPGRTGYSTVAGRTIAYAVDAHGYRVRSVSEAVDLARPTIVCIGESVMFGEGLDWDQTIPAQVGRMMHVQAADLAVHGYSSDQAYLRLQAELPRFRQPVAVVSLFMTALFGRNLDDDRPHLGPGLVWLPTEHHARLRSLAMLLVPYRRDEAVQRALERTREVLRATVQLARSRGGAALIVVPQFGPETDVDRNLRVQILEREHLPYVLVQIDEAWRLSWDRHPNARAAGVIASEIARRLRAGR